MPWMIFVHFSNDSFSLTFSIKDVIWGNSDFVLHLKQVDSKIHNCIVGSCLSFDTKVTMPLCEHLKCKENFMDTNSLLMGLISVTTTYRKAVSFFESFSCKFWQCLGSLINNLICDFSKIIFIPESCKFSSKDLTR